MLSWIKYCDTTLLITFQSQLKYVSLTMNTLTGCCGDLTLSILIAEDAVFFI